MKKAKSWSLVLVWVVGFSVSIWSRADGVPGNPLGEPRNSLFSRMVGKWRGEGRKVFTGAGQPVLIQAQVRSSQKGGALVSLNQVIETTLDAAGDPTGSKQYESIYWIRPTSDATLFELGKGIDPSLPATSMGSYKDGVFRVEQKFIQPPVIIQSRTEFVGEDETLYAETVWYEGAVYARTEIRYQRAPDDPALLY